MLVVRVLMIAAVGLIALTSIPRVIDVTTPPAWRIFHAALLVAALCALVWRWRRTAI